MRSTSIVASTLLLIACGGTESENTSQAGPEASAIPANVAIAPGEAEAQPANIVDPGADGEVGSIRPCLVQGTEQLKVEPLRAVGTEPFWSARVEGRCVTYSTPDDQQGTRVWTRYSEGPDGRGAWIGQLGGTSFEMRTRSDPGCSDGMSDKIYPIAVDLLVHGERRRGCAEKL